MDYSVGSLSDLITGKNTPNKTKVVTKKVQLKNNVSNTTNNSKNKEENSSDRVILKRGKKLKNVKQFSPKGAPVTKTLKKRKLDGNSEEEPKPKKAKNAENAEKRVARKEKPKKKTDDPEKRARTIFVGNLPITCDTKHIKQIFSKYGTIESVRIRGVPVANPKTPKKVAAIKKEFHPDRKSFHCYVVFKEREEAITAAAANGIVYKDHHLIVQLLVGEDKPDESKAIFVGNLSFYAEEEDLWKIFESCGPITSVRIVRDKKTRVGKGFGYVNFQNLDSVTLALEMENVTLKDRELRIKPCNTGAAKKVKKTGKPKKIEKPGKPRMFRKKIRNKNNENVDGGDKTKPNDNSFQGVTFSDKKKKNKINKGLLQKKRMIKKVAPK